MVVNLINPGPVELMRTIVVFHQQIHLDTLAKLDFQTVDYLPRGEPDTNTDTGLASGTTIAGLVNRRAISVRCFFA